MSQTEIEPTPPTPDEASEERIRKIYAQDLKNGEAVHTVFRATSKSRHTSRAGKSYLAMTLVDRTGEVDARIFENVEAADVAVADGDYLLVQGKVGTFHGKSQIVIERLERLDPEPIDEKEFTFRRPPEPVAEERERPVKDAPKEAREKDRAKKGDEPLKLPKRLQRLLADPQLAQALDALLGYVERMVEEKVAARLGGPATPEKRARPPKVEHRPGRTDGEKADRPERAEPKPEAKRDPSLPEGLAFKPFSQLVGDDAPATEASPPSSEG